MIHVLTIQHFIKQLTHIYRYEFDYDDCMHFSYKNTYMYFKINDIKIN